MSLSPHPLCVHDALPSRKQNRESRVKNACNSNSHSNIAASNDKRPLFVQIPATSSASLVSTSLPIQCLRQTNSFFYRGIFPNGFLGTVFHHVPKGISRECLRRTHVCLGVDRRVCRIHRRRKAPMIQSLGLFFFAGRPKAIHFRACLGGLRRISPSRSSAFQRTSPQAGGPSIPINYCKRGCCLAPPASN